MEAGETRGKVEAQQPIETAPQFPVVAVDALGGTPQLARVLKLGGLEQAVTVITLVKLLYQRQPITPRHKTLARGVEGVAVRGL